MDSSFFLQALGEEARRSWRGHFGTRRQFCQGPQWMDEMLRKLKATSRLVTHKATACGLSHRMGTMTQLSETKKKGITTTWRMLPCKWWLLRQIGLRWLESEDHGIEEWPHIDIYIYIYIKFSLFKSSLQCFSDGMHCSEMLSTVQRCCARFTEVVLVSQATAPQRTLNQTIPSFYVIIKYSIPILMVKSCIILQDGAP
jgi:hypothetical protein